MNITKSYIEGVKQRVELVKDAYKLTDLHLVDYHTRNLIEYLDGLDYFVEEEKLDLRPVKRTKAGKLDKRVYKELTSGTTKDIAGGNIHYCLDCASTTGECREFCPSKRMTCEICHNPLYVRQDGSLACVEMHH